MIKIFVACGLLINGINYLTLLITHQLPIDYIYMYIVILNIC